MGAWDERRHFVILLLLSGAALPTAAMAQDAGLPPVNSEPRIGAAPLGGPPAQDAASAAAVQSGDPQADAFRASAGSGEIVVTAQRRSERLTDVPASITAISAETLVKAGITNTSDLARVTPGVTMPFFGSFLQPSIRGVTSTGANVGESPNVAMYIDGVYQPQQIATLIDLPDVQQIEILKGPQGALYGQNATGGAILVTSLAPSFTSSGLISASFGAYDAVNLRGYVTGPVTRGVAFSIAGGYQNRDGFRRHILTDERDRGLDSKVIRGKLLFEPSDTARITLTAFYSDRFDSAMYAGVPYKNNSASYAAVPTAPRVTSPKQFAANPDVGTAIESWGGNIRAEFDLDAGTINSITAYTRNKVNYLADVDMGPVNLAFAEATKLEGEFFSQELNFVSSKFGAFSFMAGAFYLKSEEGFDTSDFIQVVPTLPPAPWGPAILYTKGQNQYKKEVIAPYAEVSLDVSDEFVVTVGGRYSHERQRVAAVTRILPAPKPPLVDRPGGPVTFTQFSPRVTARYALTSYANVYASFGKGFKSGIVNTTNLAQDPVNPEKIEAWEVGFKGRVTSDLNVNAAAFLYNYKDLQVVAHTPPLYLQQNAATARIKGVEAEASWRAAPGLSVAGGFSYLDANYVSFPAAQVFQPNPTGTGNASVTRDLSGFRLLRSPKWSGNLTVNYEVETGSGTLGAFISGYYNSGFGLEPEGRVRQGEYATVDAEISFQPQGMEGLRLVLWGKNITDSDYLVSSLVNQLADGVSYAEPRTYGVRAEFRF